MLYFLVLSAVKNRSKGGYLRNFKTILKCEFYKNFDN